MMVPLAPSGPAAPAVAAWGLSEGSGRTEFTERRSAIDEDLALTREASKQPRQGYSTKRGVPSVQGADAQGEGEIKRLVSRFKFESLNRHLPERQAPRGQFLFGASASLLDRLCRAITASRSTCRR